MLEIGKDGLLNGSSKKKKKGGNLEKDLAPSVSRLFSVACELGVGTTVDQVYKATGIDAWFLEQINEIVRFEKQLNNGDFQLNRQVLSESKLLGFSDNLIAKYFATTEQKIRNLRKKWQILPKVKHIDTLAAEYPAGTNYLYLTYHGQSSEEKTNKREKAIVLGAGPYRIGSSVEFDWCCVTTALTLAKKGVETIVINCNPETVSTDFDFADKLYFEELTFERVSDIYEIEQGAGLVLSVGGQVPNNLALSLHQAGLKILGTSPLSIDQAENRHKFSQLLDAISVEQPVWQQLKTNREAKKFAKKIGYPVLIRPSYVLSGSAMNVAYSADQLEAYLKQATQVSDKYPVVISKFIENAKEVEIDGVAQDGRLVIYAISEHVENAGVHSGDATLVLPPQRLYIETMRQIKVISKKIIQALKVNGPFNIQFLAKNNRVMVIELNLRASRSFPFVSKVTGYNFIEIASKVLLGETVQGNFQTVDLDYVGVKTPQFSFNRMKGADPRLKVEMSSTGEVACFGDDFGESYLKALLSTGWKLPIGSVFLSIGGQQQKVDFLDSAKKLARMNLTIYATDQTSQFLKENGIENTIVHKISSRLHPSVLDFAEKGKIDLVINISRPNNLKAGQDGFFIRRSCADLNIPLFTNLQAAVAFVEAITDKGLAELKIKSWDEYVSSAF